VPASSEKIAKRILAEARPGDAVLIAAYQLSHLGGDVQASRDGFSILPASRSKAPRQVTIYAQALQNVLGQGRGQGPAGDRDRGGAAAGWAGHLPAGMVPPG